MNKVFNQLAEAAARLGYRQDAILRDYPFSDFSSQSPLPQRAPLAIFTQTPASYRSAAFGAACQSPLGAEATVRAHASLGAPLFFVISADKVTVWQVYAGGPPRLIESARPHDLAALFEVRRDIWAPEAIHRAKSIGRIEPAYQLDFVDVGLLPTIEGQIHEKLDRLLTETLSSTDARSDAADARGIFQGVFRLLAAKILLDRGHSLATSWNTGDVASVLVGIGAYYGLVAGFDVTRIATKLDNAWKVLARGISVANISADDLAFVYENTLVTPATRQKFGTHSTPRHVAEYVVSRLGLWRAAESPPEVYEPFAGAGVFLVSALRHMREALPHDWDDQRRHDLLVNKISGSEADTFACEVATLSLILADYPNRNGWKVETRNLFEDGVLRRRLSTANVILCNPPFEAFNAEQRVRYPDITSVSGAQAEAVLMLALQARPDALGFVLPQAFLMDRAYREHRRLIEQRFREVELVSLPDGVFRVSQVETALLIARDPIRGPRDEQTIRASVVDDRDRQAFRLTEQASRSRELRRPMPVAGDGSLWIPPLGPLWRRIAGGRTLGSIFEGHWGIRWLDNRQSAAASEQPGVNRALGLLNARDHRQFVLGRPTWLDIDPNHLYGAGELPWDRPKILCNAARLSRGRWRLGAAVDDSGLRASQQFVCLWPRSNEKVDLDAYVAILNSPLANAFLDDHSTDRRLRIATLLSLPIPGHVPSALGDLAREYESELARRRRELDVDTRLGDLLDAMDSLVIESFDLPPRSVRALLASFGAQERPVVHDWQPWGVSEADPALTISELRSKRIAFACRNWLRDELPPVSTLEAEQASTYFP